ncbi:MAG TPA: hypothetical protein VER76_08845 [Pyrinomonadaceae bacterium]|nr:hypothetical protein [Pyrinomonadaceae bacterium]
MRFIVMLWAGVEVLQIFVIGLLIVNQRKLQRRLAEAQYFSTARPPRSITEDNN